MKKSVFIPPGATIFIPIPNWFNSKAMLSLQPSSAHFVAWYIELNGTVINPPIEVVLMKSPALFSLKWGMNAFVVRIGPIRLVLTMRTSVRRSIPPADPPSRSRRC